MSERERGVTGAREAVPVLAAALLFALNEVRSGFGLAAAAEALPAFSCEVNRKGSRVSEKAAALKKS